MPLSFPGSPSVGQVYTFGNNSWSWDGTHWNAISTYAVQHDGTTTAGTSYVGTAPTGTTNSSATWKLTKIVVASSGATTVTRATDSWNNRVTATYS